MVLAEYLQTGSRPMARGDECVMRCRSHRERINATLRAVARIKETKRQVVSVTKDR